MVATTENGNGQVDLKDSAVSDILQDEVTLGYRPQIPLEAMWMSGAGDMPQITLRRDIEFMQFHPTVLIALEYYKSGIAGAEFWGGPDQKNPDNDKGKPISPDERVSQFVLSHVEKFWQIGMPMLQEGGYPYGWAPGEHIYKELNGMLVWSHLKAFHPNDGFVLTLNNQPIGIRVKNVRSATGDDRLPSSNNPRGKGGETDLWFASESIPAKAAWYSHRPRFNHFYGRTQLAGAWRPWRRLGWRDGIEQVIDAAIYRAGYVGPVVRYPPGHSASTAKQGVPATQADSGGGSRRENRDTARQIVEWSKAGAGFALSSERYPQAMGGELKWDVEWPEHVMDVMPLINAAKYVEDQIFLGIGVPPELIRAGGTGSGYSGRSIPREAFLDGQQRVADAILRTFVEQVIKPLVLWNFGDIPFNIQCKSLLKSQAEDKSSQDQQQGQRGMGPNGRPQANSQQIPKSPQARAFALTMAEARRDTILEIVRRVRERMVA